MKFMDVNTKTTLTVTFGAAALFAGCFWLTMMSGNFLAGLIF
jgi:hypothetical protein